MEQKKVVGFGEVLIDFSPMGAGPMGNPAMEMNTGGSPLNCMAAVAALGGNAEFIGMLGDDIFADEIEKSVKAAQVGSRSLLRTNQAPTTLAFVAIDDMGGTEIFIHQESGGGPADRVWGCGPVGF